MLSFWVGGIGGNCNGLDLGFHTSDAATPPPSPSSSPGTGKYYSLL